MKNPFSFFLHKQQKEYYLSCDFGYDITSPIPSVEPVHNNSHCVVPAIAGTTVKLFPKERTEIAEFGSYIMDENQRIIGLKCRIKQDPKISEFFGIPEDPGWEVDLICGKDVFIDNNKYENGKNTHTYYRFLLLDTDELDESEQNKE